MTNIPTFISIPERARYHKSLVEGNIIIFLKGRILQEAKLNYLKASAEKWVLLVPLMLVHITLFS